MIFPFYGGRWSCDTLINYKNQWLIKINDILNNRELCDIVYRENAMDKCAMNPLTHYIVINKLSTHKHLEILEDPDFWKGIDHYREVRDLVIHQLKFNYITDFDDHTVNDIIEIIQRAFNVHGSQKLISDYITNNMQKMDDNGVWYTTIDIFFPGVYPSFNDIKLINWNQNIKYFHAFYQIDSNGEFLIIMLYNILNDNVLSYAEPLSHVSDSPEWTIIVNTFNGDITEYLLYVINKLKDSESDDDTRNETFDVILRLLFSDHNVFGFIGENEIFLIYHQIYQTEHFQISVNCKFAAKIGEWCAAVFEDQKGFYAYHQQATIERMSFKDTQENGITILEYVIPQ